MDGLDQRGHPDDAEAKFHEAKAEAAAFRHEAEDEAACFDLETEVNPRGPTSLVATN